MVKVKIIFFMSTLFFFSACSVPNHFERNYLKHVREEGNHFKISSTSFDSVWFRGKAFIIKYSSLPIMEINDSLIETVSPSFFEHSLGYKITASRMGDSARFVSAYFKISPWRMFYSSWNPFTFPYNVLILTDYMRSDSLPYPNLISK
jgi:hypothetical protein